jgi:hypothetical protein
MSNNHGEVMTNNQAKRLRAIRHNKLYNSARVRKANNDYARDNFSISVSYYVRVVLGNSNPNKIREDMRKNLSEKASQSSVSKEIEHKCIEFLTHKSNEMGELLVWENVIEELKETFELNPLDATHVFIAWVRYMDNRKILSKAIDFNE